MTFDTTRLFNLLPANIRIHDDEQGGPLRALLTVIAEQAGVLEDNLAQLYDDQFIETCAPWVVPYIGDLIGVNAVHDVAGAATSRAEVANTIGYRRRKGTVVMLQQLAHDVTGWDARAVEFFLLLAATQYMNHLRLDTLYVPNLRAWEPLERLGTAFDPVARLVDVRRIATGAGRYNIPNIGIFLFRLGSYPHTQVPATMVPSDQRRYLFSPLGINVPLFNYPQPLGELTTLAQPTDVPMPISRRVLAQYTGDYYGGSILVTTGINSTPVDVKQILAADLRNYNGGWAHTPPASSPPNDMVLIDPVLGRILFPANQPPPNNVRVTFHTGFSANMGGGEYQRQAPYDAQIQPTRRVPDDSATIKSALNTITSGGADGAVRITTNDTFAEALSPTLAVNQRIEVWADTYHHPAIQLTTEFLIAGDANAEITLNGLLLFGNGIRVTGNGSGGNPARVRLVHCTLVPGLTLAMDGAPPTPAQPSVIVESSGTILEIDHCIVGGVRVAADASAQISDSIVDATAEDSVAYAAPDGSSPGGPLDVRATTVVGKVAAVNLDEASNCIFLARLSTPTDTWIAPVVCQRRQDGCIRFSYVPLEARVPRRYHCQPEGAGDAARRRPQFTSLRYGDPGYAQLSRGCAVEIRQGADDEAEMGAFHQVFAPQRETNLRIRLDEYLRFGLETGIFYAT